MKWFFGCLSIALLILTVFIDDWKVGAISFLFSLTSLLSIRAMLSQHLWRKLLFVYIFIFIFMFIFAP